MSLLEERRHLRDAEATLSALGWQPGLPDFGLDVAGASDLQLAMSGLLPAGHLLGSPVLGTPRGPLGTVRVPVPSAELLTRALEVGRIVLHDDEGTPLAMLQELSVDPIGELAVQGTPCRLRRPEPWSGSVPSVDLDDAMMHGRPVLVMARPALEPELEQLMTWLRASGSPVLLVPDHRAGPRKVPTSVLLQLADRLLREAGAQGSVRTVPIGNHSDRAEELIFDEVVARMEPSRLWRLSDTEPALTANLWANARRTIVEDRADRGLAGVPAPTLALLRTWRPRRATRGLALMFTGLSGSGKSTLARDVGSWLTSRSPRTVTLLDGDRVRKLLSSDLAFDPASRVTNIRRIGYVATEIVRHGGVAICSPIAPFAATRAEVRGMVEEAGDFVLVHVATPLEECERRDRKGLYARARLGALPEFTGISSPYEVPDDADLVVDTSRTTRESARALVVGHLRRGGWIEER